MIETEELVREVVGGETYEFVPLGENVVRAPGVCGGRPTFKYTRIEVAPVLELLGAGESIDQIVTGYNGRVSREAIQEAVDIAVHRFLSGLPDLAPV